MQIKYFAAPLIWALLIFYLSTIPGHDLPDMSFWKLLTFDKMAHATMYSVLAFYMMRSCIRQHKNWWIRYHATSIGFATGIVYGGFIELYQAYLTTDRHGDWMDMLANLIGTLLGILVFRVIFKEFIV